MEASTQQRQCVAYCPMCGTFRVQHLEWVWANDAKIAGGFDSPGDEAFCTICDHDCIDWAYHHNGQWMSYTHDGEEVVGTIREVMRKCTKRTDWRSKR
jgi:hypothetical protein